MYNTFVFKPLYNGLVGLMDLLPWIDIGVAVVIFTIIVKLALFHLSKASILTQIKMKEVEPEVNQIKTRYANDRQTQALKVMELYKSRNVKPFAGILRIIFIQLPVLLALLSVFYKIIPTINPEYLYSFINVPIVKTQFLGLINLTKPSLILAILTAIAQFVQLHFSLASKQFKPQINNKSSGMPPLDIAASMNKQMKFMLPALAFASIYWLIPVKFPQAASIIALYWSVSALFTLGQELVIRKQYLINRNEINLMKPDQATKAPGRFYS